MYTRDPGGAAGPSHPLEILRQKMFKIWKIVCVPLFFQAIWLFNSQICDFFSKENKYKLRILSFWFYFWNFLFLFSLLIHLLYTSETYSTNDVRCPRRAVFTSSRWSVNLVNTKLNSTKLFYNFKREGLLFLVWK